MDYISPARQAEPARVPARESRVSRGGQIPEYPKSYRIFPSILLMCTLALMGVGLSILPGDDYKKIAWVPVLGVITFCFQLNHLIAEMFIKSYNSFFILVPDSILFLIYVPGLFVLSDHIGGSGVEKALLVAVTALYSFVTVLLLIKVFLFGFAIARHCERGGNSSAQEDIEMI